MKHNLLSATLIPLLCVAVLLLAMALRPAHAQYFGGSDLGRGVGYVPQPGYRAINHDPKTGRTYAREADILVPKPRVVKRKARR